MTIIDEVFTRLTLIYGTRFTCHWPESAVPAAKLAWLNELRDLSNESITYGLDNLPPGNPPMAIEFRDLCRKYSMNRPARVSVQSSPQTDEERARAVAILQGFKRPDPQGPKAWAWRLRARELAGERLTLYYRSCWREVLAHELHSDA